ncbi:hypothetical protein E2562_025917 [Oryza meyeriana var. granulata]|uniref:Uncharacterized protein n=1 Tax=Oryza meyeriana var. granulata TaxID=110450 RepID=A0A6G1CJN4_9ORYZ|nr:hypothetical protein E2562_025917 [Oryza meyeriana var. granulata]
MPLAISSAGRPSARARLVVVLAGAAPARTATVPLRPLFPSAATAGRFARGGRGDGKLGGGGGARLAGPGIYTALRRPTSKNKNSPFHSSGGAAVLCLARRAFGEGDGDDGDAGAHRVDGNTEGAGAGGDHHNAEKACDLTKDKGTEGRA